MYSDMNKEIDENKYLVYFIIKKYFRLFSVDEDVFQIGMIALWEAIRDFDTTRGTKFSTYACIHIYSVIAGYFRKQMAKCRVISSDEVLISLDELYYSDGQETKSDFLEDSNSNTIMIVELKEFLVTYLSKTEQKILNLRIHGYKQREIGEQLGYSQKQVSRTLQKIKQKYLQF